MTYNAQIDRTKAQPLQIEDVADEVIQGVTATSATLQLGTPLPDMPSDVRRLPVLDTLPTAYFVSGDAGLRQTASLQWANKYLYAEEIAVIIPIPRRVISDSAYDLWAQVRPRVQESFSLAIDAAVMFGTNKPTDWPAGIATTAAARSASISLASRVDLYDAMLGIDGVHQKVEEDGFDVTGVAARVSMKGRYRSARDANGQPIFSREPETRSGYAFDGAPLAFVKAQAWTAANTLAIAGDFSQLVYAFNRRMEFALFSEGVITDNAGVVVYNLMQQDMVALRATMIMAWQIPNPINADQPTEASRFPFAILTT